MPGYQNLQASASFNKFGFSQGCVAADARPLTVHKALALSHDQTT
jgi:hypothetical protein